MAGDQGDGLRVFLTEGSNPNILHSQATASGDHGLSQTLDGMLDDDHGASSTRSEPASSGECLPHAHMGVRYTASPILPRLAA